MHDAYIGGRFQWTKITCKASDVAENLQLYRVVQFFRPRSSCTTMHISADVQRITLNASCMTISDGRTKQLDTFCRITGYTNDYLSFIVVEFSRFFNGALQLWDKILEKNAQLTIVEKSTVHITTHLELTLNKNCTEML